MSMLENYRICVPVTAVLAEPSAGAVCTSEGLYGEHITVLEQQGSWLKVQQRHDDYTGFVSVNAVQALDHVTPQLTANTHWVQMRSTFLFEQPDYKSPVVHRLPFASELSLVETVDTAFSRTACEHYVWTDHCLPLNQTACKDPLSLARTHFLGSPYRWGGRSPDGADCSGLIQQLARSQGLAIPRDSADQELAIATVVPADQYQCMDLVYWPGHVGILLSATEVLHATAQTLSCIIEPLQEVVARAGSVSSVRRLFEPDTSPVCSANE